MCGRFTMTRRERTEVAALLGIPESEIGDYTPRFNIAPTQPYFVLKTKAETVDKLPSFWRRAYRSPWSDRPCGRVGVRRLRAECNQGDTAKRAPACAVAKLQSR